MLSERTIAIVLLLALLPASVWGFVCAINCNYMAPMKHTIAGDPEMTAHHHSHHAGRTMASACYPAGARAVETGCLPNVEFFSTEARWRVNFDSVAIAPAPIFSAIGTYSEIAFLSSSPPASLIKSVASTLRI